MAYIPYGQNTVGGQQVAEVMADMQDVVAKLQSMGDWINQIGPANLVDHPDFMVGAGNGSAFNDTFLQIMAAYVAFWGDGSGGTVREKVSRLARGS